MDAAAIPHCPRLSPRVRLRHDAVRNTHVLLMAEKVVRLNSSAAEILSLCDGTRTVEDIVAILSSRYPGAHLADDVVSFLRAASMKGWLV